MGGKIRSRANDSMIFGRKTKVKGTISLIRRIMIMKQDDFTTKILICYDCRCSKPHVASELIDCNILFFYC